jgi:putative addiction module component (TIGR02574 family)
MSDAAVRLKNQLAQLSPDDRAELAHFLLDSLGEAIDADEDLAWEAELLRRDSEYRSGAVQALPAREAIESLREGDA